MRIALGIEYDGSGYNGWQEQSHDSNTVQEALQSALTRVAAHPVQVICAGRTDAGVHASGQVVHFDTEAQRPDKAWVLGGNSNLPEAICVRWAMPVDPEFHARFSARRRAYRYVIFNRDVKPTFLRKRVTWERRPLDVAAMAAAAVHLVGEHDFTSYRTVACQARSPVREIHRLELHREGQFVFLDVEANGFLHHMVRNIAGVLIAIGCGERSPHWAQQVLEARDRTAGGVTAPPHGLYLAEVGYPEHFGLPRLSRTPLVW